MIKNALNMSFGANRVEIYFELTIMKLSLISQIRNLVNFKE